MELYSRLENGNEELKYFFKVMDDGVYFYDFVLENYLIPRAIKISEKLDDVVHSEGLLADHDELTHYALRLLGEENSQENIKYYLGLIDIEEKFDSHMKRIIALRV